MARVWLGDAASPEVRPQVWERFPPGLLAGLSRGLMPFLNTLPLLQGLGRGAAPQRRLSCGQTGLRVYLARGSSISLLTWPCHKLRGHAGGA